MATDAQLVMKLLRQRDVFDRAKHLDPNMRAALIAEVDAELNRIASQKRLELSPPVSKKS